jgi:tetratricopeptide (TPR) repeat protein
MVDQSVPANIDTTPAEWLPEVPETQPEPVEAPGELPAWLQQAVEDEPAPQAQEPAKSSLEDWLQSLENESAAPETAPAQEPELILAEAWQPETAPVPSEIDPNLTGKPALNAAQAALNHGHLDPALDIYNRFINNGEMLDEVIHDLRDALYRYPVDISVWQSLGDAYARNNQLQEALDAYTKAEELLR